MFGWYVLYFDCVVLPVATVNYMAAAAVQVVCVAGHVQVFVAQAAVVWVHISFVIAFVVRCVVVLSLLKLIRLAIW